MSGNIVLVISCLLLLVLCLGVFLSNPRKPVNRALTAFLFSGLLWVLANLLANISTTDSASLGFTRATIIGGSLSALTFLIFVTTYVHSHKLTRRYLISLSTAPLLIILSSPTSWNIISAESHGMDVKVGPLYLLLIIVLISYYSYGIYVLAKSYKQASSTEKSQLQYIFAGVILTVIPALITNVVLPALGSSQASAYGSVSVVAISLFTSLAIIRHRLLDIRVVVARSIAYVLLLVWIAGVYTACLFGIIDVFLPGSKHDALRQFLSIIFILPLVLSFPYVKSMFDRLTSKIFYRDRYDTQVVLDELGNLLVAEIDLHKILLASKNILSGAVKCSFMEFVLFEDGIPTLEATSNKDLQTDLTNLVTHLRTAREDVLAREELNPKSELYELLNLERVAISLRLQTQHQKVGYILFGDKQSGNSYSQQDTKLLTIAVNELAVAIQNALRFEEIKKFNITLQQRVEEATGKLRKANLKLRELDKTKDEFISMASHQLRTPLTTVKGYLSMILDGDVGPVKKDQKELMQNAFDGANRMVYLIADLLNVSRLQSGKFVIDDKPTELTEVVAGEVLQLKEQAAARQIELIYQKPEGFPALNLDETKIRQVVMNFLDNALYYTPKGGKVVAALEATDSTISYTVTDNGVGVPKEVQHRLFSKFYRAENARKMRPDGTGLGLFMAKKVVVAEGGAIIFKSSEGKGSTFGFSFPRKPKEVKAGETPKAAQRP